MRTVNTKHHIVHLTLVSGVFTLLFQAIAVPCNIIVASLLGPGGFGVVKLFGLMRNYFGYTDLGLMNTLKLKIPEAVSQENEKEVQTIQDVTFTGSFSVLFIAISILWILFFCSMTFGGVLTPLRLVILTIMLISFRVSAYIAAYLNGVGNFSLTVASDLIVASSSSIIMLVLVYVWQVEGALGALLIVSIMPIGIYLSRVRIHMPRIRYDWEKLKTCTLFGMLLFASNFVRKVFLIIDSTVIALMLGTKELGLFGFAYGAITLASSVSKQFIPMLRQRMIMERGQISSDEQRMVLSKYHQNPLVAFIAFNALCIGCASIALMGIITLFLTDFQKSIACLPILGCGYLFYKSGAISATSMVVENKLFKRLCILVTGLVINGILDVIFIMSGFGIVGAAWASTIGFGVYAIIINGYVQYRLSRSIKVPIIFLGKIFGCIGSLYFVLYGCTVYNVIYFQLGERTIQNILLACADIAIKMGVFSTLTLIAFLGCFGRQGLYAEIKEFVLYFLRTFSKRLLGEAKENKNEVNEN